VSTLADLRHAAADDDVNSDMEGSVSDDIGDDHDHLTSPEERRQDV